jgi:hypothetical protein
MWSTGGRRRLDCLGGPVAVDLIVPEGMVGPCCGEGAKLSFMYAGNCQLLHGDKYGRLTFVISDWL